MVELSCNKFLIEKNNNSVKLYFPYIAPPYSLKFKYSDFQNIVKEILLIGTIKRFVTLILPVVYIGGG